MDEGAFSCARGGGVNISTSFSLFTDNFHERFSEMLSFSLSSEWYRVVTNQSVDKLKNLTVSYLETDCSSSFIPKMKFRFLDPDFFFSLIHHLAKFTQ